MKNHTLENVSYRFVGGHKWKFSFQNKKGQIIQFISRIDKVNVDKAARIVNGAAKRGGMDNMARFHLNKLEMEFNYVPSGKKSNGVLAGFLRQ